MTSKTAAEVDPNEAVQKEIGALIESINQANKIFLRNQLSMTWEEIAGTADFILAIALWKKKGANLTEWNFVLNMTDREIMEELGFNVDAIEEAIKDE